MVAMTMLNTGAFIMGRMITRSISAPNSAANKGHQHDCQPHTDSAGCNKSIIVLAKKALTIISSPAQS